MSKLIFSCLFEVMMFEKREKNNVGSFRDWELKGGNSEGIKEGRKKIRNKEVYAIYWSIWERGNGRWDDTWDVDKRFLFVYNQLEPF